MSNRACFFRIQEKGRDSLWMVDPSIDPRQKKAKFKWSPKPFVDQATTIKAINSDALGLTIDMQVPPSAAALNSSNAVELDQMSAEAFTADFEQVLRDLEDMQKFYRERAEK